MIRTIDSGFRYNMDSRETQRGVEKEQRYFSSVRQKDCALEESQGPDP